MKKEDFALLVFEHYDSNQRFTQDSPVYPEVWLQYFDVISKPESQMRVDVILTPHRESSASKLLQILREHLSMQEKKNLKHEIIPIEVRPWRLAVSGEAVACQLSFLELVLIALPMTEWWQKYLIGSKESAKTRVIWLKKVVGGILDHMKSEEHPNFSPAYEKLILDKIDEVDKANKTDKKDNKKSSPLQLPMILWAVNLNRPATTSLYKSVATTKGDASIRLFKIDGSGISWAVLDTGIDAKHDAFRKKGADGKLLSRAMIKVGNDTRNNTRIAATYDFTRFRDLLADLNHILLNPDLSDSEKVIHSIGKTSDDSNKPLSQKEINDYLSDIEQDLRRGMMIEWQKLEPLLRIPHNARDYVSPKNSHGTHVAGIIGADWKNGDGEKDIIGMCPGIELYDIRVMNDSGVGEEFNILAAIQFVRWLNRRREQITIHGINISLSMIHDIASYACGRTPICEACQKLISEGVVVVAAAGNLGQVIYQLPKGNNQSGYRTVNITDPGNAEDVITVGSTHRSSPHNYGVSYFSSRGPTGDGRCKPDLVAPGEKIVSTIPGNGVDRKDGTSMAAPHVSGAAALLMARHRELIGNPTRVKDILCRSAVSLNREKYFQGCGMVDVLKALQSL